MHTIEFNAQFNYRTFPANRCWNCGHVIRRIGANPVCNHPLRDESEINVVIPNGYCSGHTIYDQLRKGERK